MLQVDVDPVEAVAELYAAAESGSVGTMMLGLVEFGALERGDDELSPGRTRQHVTRELSELVRLADTFADGAGEEHDSLLAARVRTKVELIVYMAFWEAHTVHRLLGSLLTACRAKDYDPHLYDGGDLKTHSRFDQICAQTRRARPKHPKLRRFIEQAYCTQLRNAVAHTDFILWKESPEGNGVLELLNHDPTKDASVARIPLSEWDAYYAATYDFLNALFERRVETLNKYRDCVVEARFVQHGVRKTAEIWFDQRRGGMWMVTDPNDPTIRPPDDFRRVRS